MWNLYKNDQFLKPLVFSNGKSQEDIVKEVLEAMDKGSNVIFIHGVCGTGKSAIALNIARKLGKSSIIVPGKTLQTQYKKDYEGNTYLLKDNKEKLKISVVTGRNNHECQFLKDNKNAIPIIKKEINSKLHDIFEKLRLETEEQIQEDISADNRSIPCKIEIKERNLKKIKAYLRQNKKVDMSKISEIRDVKRIPLASVCPYWCPVLPEKYELEKLFPNAEKKTYMGLQNQRFNIYKRKPGCKFYEQFDTFVDADVIVFNSLKYKLESALNRKPLTEVEIIDECDEFLDSFSASRRINIDYLQNSLITMGGLSGVSEDVSDELFAILKQIKKDKRITEAVYTKKIIPLKETGVYDLIKVFLDSPEFLNEIDNESYLFDIEETARMFESYLDETYLTFNKKDNNLIVNLVTTNLAKKFKEMIDKNKKIVLMSGTIHSEHVLKNIFGLENYKIIDAETEQQGTIDIIKTGLEIDCKYSNFSSGKHTREEYLKALSKCVDMAKKPTLIHIHSFADLPSPDEIKEYDLNNLISKEEIRESQKADKTGHAIIEFKKGDKDKLFTTKCSRGIDFPGTECNSIVFTKYPNPNVQDAFWKILHQTKPQHYWGFYKDKARRELLQKIYRGLRFKDDHIYLLSPDTRVLDFFGQ